jgi:murein DD-endopeptidase MepM/ murein hydrolase activator NlpD
MTWCWPLARRELPPPSAPAAGAFGAVRRHDVHTGVDLYAEEDAAALAVEDGVVVAVEDFTGPGAGSPWWLDTQAVLVEGASGVVLYGEVHPAVGVGDVVRRGDVVGRVRRVLRHDKGRPTAMLHVELHARGTRASAWWRHGEPRPAALLDPTEHLRGASDDPLAP